LFALDPSALLLRPTALGDERALQLGDLGRIPRLRRDPKLRLFDVAPPQQRALLAARLVRPAIGQLADPGMLANPADVGQQRRRERFKSWHCQCGIGQIDPVDALQPRRNAVALGHPADNRNEPLAESLGLVELPVTHRRAHGVWRDQKHDHVSGQDERREARFPILARHDLLGVQERLEAARREIGDEIFRRFRVRTRVGNKDAALARSGLACFSAACRPPGFSRRPLLLHAYT
jgi:hypothetical protein